MRRRSQAGFLESTSHESGLQLQCCSYIRLGLQTHDDEKGEDVEEEKQTDDEVLDAEESSQDLEDTPIKCHQKAVTWVSDDESDQVDEAAGYESVAEANAADKVQDSDALKDPLVYQAVPGTCTCIVQENAHPPPFCRNPKA